MDFSFFFSVSDMKSTILIQNAHESEQLLNVYSVKNTVQVTFFHKIILTYLCLFPPRIL